MFSTITTIAVNSFRETIRNKILYNILLFAGIIIVLSVSFGQWSVFSRVQVMNDFGLATMSLSGLMLAVFVGSSMLGKEITGHTIYLMATRPIPRGYILWGKFFGVYATLFLNFLIMALFFVVALSLSGGQLGLLHLQALFLIFIELGVILAASLLFSVLSSPSLAAIFTIGFYVIGHFNDMVGVNALGDSQQWLSALLSGINKIIPNLEFLNIRSAVVFQDAVASSYMLFATLYGLLYILIFLFIATLAFEKKDL